ncbi:MAG: BlaI/MecI/CopY family transcriptional regulator [Lentimicrobiaceae bacterium]|nr:BlaI/MecI/CopY family transcriptional regulator [Lentimicrobiaceae bacterium]
MENILKNDKVTYLTPAEEKIMFALWNLKNAAVNDILPFYSEPKPAYTTVSTLIRILEKKKIVSHQKEGKTHIYFPLIDKNDYIISKINHIINNNFDESVDDFLNFLMKSGILPQKAIDNLCEEYSTEKPKPKKKKKKKKKK